ncbi:hypothetical protein CHS0354_032842 [Potamilus streckersoni]|uniref:PH domain-containing protein n=1 Tax=Potamilus streckersoni TaxID=2493646 RepID=A0AAE0S9A7_9BIVA|nr:hypothetical protein CHS0354_032842 [Potamilus streckersoni]
MRLNEKSLAKYASSGAPAAKEGVLLKKGELNKGFQKRWFILKGNLLFYYEKRTDKEPIGMIVLEGCTIELADNIDGFTFQINFPGSGSRTYILGADTQEEMESWMKILSCAGYDYMKLVRSELQQQLSELDSDAEVKLLKDALLDSNHFTHFHGTTSNASSTEGKNLSHQRFNPFNSGDPAMLNVSRESHQSSSQSFDEKKTRTFLEMHEEFGAQIQELSECWRRRKSKNST